MKLKKLIGMTALAFLMAQAGLVSAAISPVEVDSIVAFDYESQGLTLNRADIASMEVTSRSVGRATDPAIEPILERYSADY